MAILSIPEKNIQITDPSEIRAFFTARNIYFDQWSCDVVFDDAATQEEIIKAYEKDLQPFMEAGGYQTADVISINKLTENYEAIRNKFLAEHTHSEDEIRFFVDGQGLFWFNLDNEPVFNLLCEQGDLISVPAGTKHWFDAGATAPFVKAIRIFIDMSGWVPHYTESKEELKFADFVVPTRNKVKFILTDIEGTTSSVNFVYEVLFPYFRAHLNELPSLLNHPDVQQAIEDTQQLHRDETGQELTTAEEVIAILEQWSREDRKVTPLKTIQGVIWKKGYESGEIKGHVYPEVAQCLENWKELGLKMGVFSSGSVAAQKLIFANSVNGDLTPYFEAYFDTTTGGKREVETYRKIADQLNLPAKEILFLSDIREELKAAEEAGFQTIQLVRQGTEASWKATAKDFSAIQI